MTNSSSSLPQWWKKWRWVPPLPPVEITRESSCSVTLPHSWTSFISTPGSSSLVRPVAEVANLVIIPVWLFDIYENTYVDTFPVTVLINTWRIRKCVQQRFIAYIVNLTHVMETLFILADRKHKMLTRRAIKAACEAYRDSSLMTVCIQRYRELDERDAASEMIEDLIKPERCNDSSIKNYYAEINKRDLGKQSLDQDEEW